MKHRTSINTLVIYLGNIFSAVSAFCVTTIMARQLGPADYGSLISVIVLMNMLIQLSDFGTNKTVVRMSSSSEEYGLTRNQVISSIFIIRMTFAAIVTILCFLLANYIASGYYKDARLALYVRLITFGIGFGALFQIATSMLQENEQFILMSVNKVLVSLTKLIGCLLLVYAYNMTLIGAVVVNVCPYVFGAVIGYFGVRKLFKIEIVTFLTIKTIFTYSFAVTITQTASIFMLNIPSMLLANFGDKSQLGFFSAAQNVALCVNMMSESLLVVLLPNIVKNSNVTNLYENAKRISEKLIIYAIPLLILVVSSKLIIKLVYGNEFIKATIILSILLCASILDFVTISYSASMYMMKNTNAMIMESVVRAIILYISCSVLIRTYGAIGASFAVLINATLSALLRYLIIKRSSIYC